MPQSEPARSIYRELRVALRDLNSLGLDDAGDAYNTSAANATRVLLDGGTEEEAADLVIETLRIEHGTLLNVRARRRIARRIRQADPRLKEIQPDPFPSDQFPLSWLLSWQVELLLFLGVAYFVWEAISSEYPWTVLAWPGLLGFHFAWVLILRLVGASKGRWVVHGLPTLLFAVASSAMLFAVASGDERYRPAAYVSLVWVAFAGLGSFLYLRSNRNEGSGVVRRREVSN